MHDQSISQKLAGIISSMNYPENVASILAKAGFEPWG
jgi:hypothetical protein